MIPNSSDLWGSQSLIKGKDEPQQGNFLGICTPKTPK